VTYLLQVEDTSVQKSIKEEIAKLFKDDLNKRFNVALGERGIYGQRQGRSFHDQKEEILSSERIMSYDEENSKAIKSIRWLIS
jgi:hypothetical protein